MVSGLLYVYYSCVKSTQCRVREVCFFIVNTKYLHCSHTSSSTLQQE